MLCFHGKTANNLVIAAFFTDFRSENCAGEKEGVQTLYISSRGDASVLPEKRTLRRITLVDAEKADHAFGVLMGEDVEPRKEWIEKNARFAINIDI